MTCIFIHLHKCGGTTLNAALENMYKGEKIYQIDGRRYEESANDFIKLSSEKREKYDLLKGHMFYGLHEVLSQESNYITMLREPRARIVSLYNYVFRNSILDFYEKLTNDNPDFVEFVKKGYSRTADNGMTRFISGISWNDVPYGQIDGEVLELAKKNLSKFLAVGLTEDFDRSLLLFKLLLKKERYPVYLKLNTTITLTKGVSQRPILTKKDITSKDWKSIEPYIKYDEALYAYAKECYLKMLENYSDQILEEASIFQKKQDRYLLKHKLKYGLISLKKVIKSKIRFQV